MASILSTVPVKRRRKPKESFLGGWIPQLSSNYVTLYCYAFKVPKTKIIRELIKGWVKEKTKEFSVEELYKKLVDAIFESWESMEGVSFETFKTQLKVELKQRQLDADTVGKILNLVEDEKNKKTKT